MKQGTRAQRRRIPDVLCDRIWSIEQYALLRKRTRQFTSSTYSFRGLSAVCQEWVTCYKNELPYILSIKKSVNFSANNNFNNSYKCSFSATASWLRRLAGQMESCTSSGWVGDLDSIKSHYIVPKSQRVINDCLTLRDRWCWPFQPPFQPTTSCANFSFWIK